MRKLPPVLRSTRFALAIALLIAAGATVAQEPRTPEQVVVADARAWSSGDRSGLLALFAEDARLYQRPTDPHRLTGALSDKIGRKDQLAGYLQTTFASPPLAREEVVGMATVGELVIAKTAHFEPPDYALRTHYLTGYRVRDGVTHDLWHIAQAHTTASPGADPADAIRQLIAANNARDVDRFLALFSPDARNFRYSDDPRRLADQPSTTLTDASRRAQFVRRYFGSAPVRVDAVKLFSVGDLVVEQSHVTGFADAPDKVANDISIYRVRDGRIVDDWLVAEETLK